MSLVHPSVKSRFVRKLAVAAATGFGLGFSPVAPGTAGALLGCGVVWAFTAFEIPVWGQIAACAALALLCIPVASIAERDLGRGKDPGAVVCDEWMTFPICMIGMTGLWREHVWLMPMCFVVNRILDATKPPPAYRLQILPAGLGITIDDFIISIYALGVNWALFFAAERWLGL